MDKGFLYVATGKKILEEAEFSAKNIKSRMDMPITVVSDRPYDSEYFDTVFIDDNPKRSFEDKFRNLLKSPYDKTIYIDHDVQVLEPVPELFELLDNVDIITSIDPNQKGLIMNSSKEFADVPESFPIPQGGVIGYKKTDRFKGLIDQWKEIHYENDMGNDQASLRAALYRSDVRHHTFAGLYDCMMKWPIQVTGEVKIIHGHLEIDDLEDLRKIEKRVNKTHEPRLFHSTHRGQVFVPTSYFWNSIFKHISRVPINIYRFRSSVHSEGLSKSIKKSIDELLK